VNGKEDADDFVRELLDFSISSGGDAITNFQVAIAWYRDYLFGLRLFYEGCTALLGDSRQIRDPYYRTKSRVEKALEEAKKLLEKVRTRQEEAKALKSFVFPPVGGHPDLENMTFRINLLVSTYNRLFPGRDRNTPLPPRDHMKLMTEVCRTF